MRVRQLTGHFSMGHAKSAWIWRSSDPFYL
jgi:hypothetical protein